MLGQAETNLAVDARRSVPFIGLCLGIAIVAGWQAFVKWQKEPHDRPFAVVLGVVALAALAALPATAAYAKSWCQELLDEQGAGAYYAVECDAVMQWP